MKSSAFTMAIGTAMAIFILAGSGCASTGGESEANANREDIRQVMRDNMGPVNACFTARAKAVPHLQGKMVVDWVILGNGTVGPVRVVQSLDPVVDACVAAQVKTWKFPRSHDNSVVKIRYPFVFRSM